MGRYDKEIEFLKRVEDKCDMNRRKCLSNEEADALRKEYPNLPDDYIDYMKEVGFGDFRECQFMVYEAPATLDDLYDNDLHLDDNIVFFGDNFSGDSSGFDLRNTKEVIELWHESNEMNQTGKPFHEYIREMMLMDESGNDTRGSFRT